MDREAIAEFNRGYLWGTSEVLRSIERTVLGCDYGGTSYTTSTQALELAERLELGPGKRLLDIGAGSGWPALLISSSTGCDVVLADLPIDGLRIAQGRARRDGIAERTAFVLAPGEQLPFRSATFDVVTHHDVLC